MKKIILYVLLLWIFWVFFYSYIEFWQQENKKKENVKVAIDNFQKVYDYLQKNYDWEYPIPDWDLILLDNHNSIIHLEDRKTPLKNIENLSIIQWTTCDILKDDNYFQDINYDKRFSILDKNQKILHKKCFTYVVTKDQKNFQIWTVIEAENGWYKSLLNWNIKKSITKSYNSYSFVKDDSSDFLPYYPWNISPIALLKNKQNSSIEINVKPFNEKEYTIRLKEWDNIILSWDVSSYDIEIIWDLDKQSNLSFIDTNGSIIYISPQENWSKIDFKIKDYSINDKNINYFVETWRFIANIVKLSNDKNMEVKKGGITLVIRWTKFTIISWNDSFDTFLNIWHIVQKFDWKDINLTLESAFSFILWDKVIDDIQKVKELAWFTVFNDIKTNEKYEMKIDNENSNITWSYEFKKYQFSYENWQKIGLVIFDDPPKFLDYIKRNKELLWITPDITKDVEYYKNIVNQICVSNNLRRWLDITKLYYMLDNNLNTLNSFVLKNDIKSELWLIKNDYVLFTLRKYNWQYSSRLAYNSETNTIDSYNFARLSTTNKIKKIIFACDVK